MPRVAVKKIEYMVKDEMKRLRGALLAEGIRNKEIAAWINCTPQNVGQLFANGSMSYKQYVTITDHLNELYKLQKYEREMEEREAENEI